MASVDLNDLFSWVTASGNREVLQQLQQKVNERLTGLQTAQLGGQGARASEPRVQPTDVLHPGPLAGQPLTGPAPAVSGGQDVHLQAAINQETEEGQRQRGGVGIGYEPVAVNVGLHGDQEEEQAKQVMKQAAEQARKDQESVIRQVRQTSGGQQGVGEKQEAQGGVAKPPPQQQASAEKPQPPQGARVGEEKPRPPEQPKLAQQQPPQGAQGAGGQKPAAQGGGEKPNPAPQAQPQQQAKPPQSPPQPQPQAKPPQPQRAGAK